MPRMRNVFFFSLRKTVTNVFTMLIGLLISLLPFFFFFLSFNLWRRMLCTFFFFILILTFLICTRLLRLTSVLLLEYFSSIFLSCVYRKFSKKLLYFLSKIIFRFKQSERVSENYNIFSSKC